MAIVKLALSGLAGVQQSHVELGSAEVIYDAQETSAARLVSAVNDKTPFHAHLRSDAPVAPTSPPSHR